MTIRSVDEDVEWLNPSYITGRNWKWDRHFLKKVWVISYKVNLTFTIWPNNSTPKKLPKKNEKVSPHKNLSTYVLNFIRNSQKLKTTQTSIKKYIDTQIVIFPSHRILTYSNKELIIYNMDNSQK